MPASPYLHTDLYLGRLGGVFAREENLLLWERVKNLNQAPRVGENGGIPR